MVAEINKFDGIDLDALGLTRTQAAVKKNDDLNKTDFMALLVAQLENQNPLEPQENAQMVTQMAQFGMLEGVDNLNNSFSTLASTLGSNQALQASALVGRSVVVPSSSSVYVKGETFFGSMDLDQSVGDLVLSITDSSGKLVRRDHLGEQKSGNIPFIWDGIDSDGNQMQDGIYKVTAEATINGKNTAIATNLTFNVDSVTLGKNGAGLTLNLAGGESISVEDVKEIR